MGFGVLCALYLWSKPWKKTTGKSTVKKRIVNNILEANRTRKFAIVFRVTTIPLANLSDAKPIIRIAGGNAR